MTWWRRILLQTVVWLTSAATLVAGAPMFFANVPAAPASRRLRKRTAPKSCCCCPDTNQEENSPPSCCSITPTKSDDDDAPAWRPRGCQKTTVEAHTAALVGGQEKQSAPAGVQLIAPTLEDTQPACPIATRGDAWPVPPPLDRHLVFLHFVI